MPVGRIVSVSRTGILRLEDKGDMTYDDFATTLEKIVKEFGTGCRLRIRAERKTLYSQIRPVVQIACENKLYDLRLDLFEPPSRVYAVPFPDPTTMMAPKSGQSVIRVRVGHDQLVWCNEEPITQDQLRDIVLHATDFADECPFVLEVENDATCQDIAPIVRTPGFSSHTGVIKSLDIYTLQVL